MQTHLTLPSASGKAMRRRDFIAGIAGSATAWPLAARAQQGARIRRIGALMLPAADDPEGKTRAAAFEQSLGKLGWAVGHNLQIDYRWGMNDLERARVATAELLRLAPDVILANGTPALPVAKQSTVTVPIVFTVVNEPVAMGYVASLSRPGGNVTGFSNLEPVVGTKWLELLKELAPQVRRIAVIFNPETNPSIPLFVRSMDGAAQKLAVELLAAPVHEPAGIEATMTTLGREGGGGVIFPAVNFTVFHRHLIFDLAARYRLPAMYARRFFAEDGGLISYSPDEIDQFQRAAGYIDRIFKGERPADLPVQQPTKFDLVLNLKTARTLGLQVPQTLLVLADEVIE
jgi:putative tryptophan/tyrosine transport system substrate-binding protein